jgi:hypothetical protein
MTENADMTAIARLIQLAVAPVFLLTGIGAMLGVMTNRLTRIIDRSRSLEKHTPNDVHSKNLVDIEMNALAHRGRFINISITLCSLSALLIALVIAILFLGAFVKFNATMPVSLLFVTAMALLIVALLFFLREILLANSSIRIGRREEALQEEAL